VLRLLILTFLIYVTASKAYSYENSTTLFNKQNVENYINSGEIRYSDYETTAVSANLKLSSKNYYFEIFPEEKSDEIKSEILKIDVLDLLQGKSLTEDFVTAADDNYPMPERNLLGQTPVYLSDEITIDQQRFARVRIFPVTIDSAGNIIFNEALVLKIGERIILPSELLTDEDINLLKSQISKNDNRNFSSAETLDYVIITSPPLVEACQLLADYKCAVGIKTEVKIAEDIILLYSGRDDAEKLREYLKVFYADGGKYVLMAGDETILPIRHAYHSSTTTGVALDQLQIADLYFGDLDGDWNADGDNVWGERAVDLADLTPELFVGRLPFNTAEQMNNYVNKLIAYETNPGSGNTEYLERTFFFSSDQMRDYSGGQHGFIAQAFPDNFEVDTTDGVEAPSGSDPHPTNPSAYNLIDHISDGFGIVHIISHGRTDAFGVWTTGYNNWPKSYFITGPASGTFGTFLDLQNNNRVSFYYSLACDNGAFDEDIAEYGQNGHLIVSELLSLPGAGAVGFVANSRWGWVGSSYYLQEEYFSSLFANPGQPAVKAMYASKEMYYYYRDLVLGQNFYGDPTLIVYTSKPEKQNMNISYAIENRITVLSGGQPLGNSHIYISREGEMIEDGYTNSSGEYSLPTNLLIGVEYTVASVMNGYVTYLTKFTPSLATDIEQDNNILPASYALYQNYPNPFNPATSIEFDLPISSDVQINIFNNLGQNVLTLVDKQLSAGSYSIEWDGTNKNNDQVSSGIYFYKLTSEAYTETKRMILLR